MATLQGKTALITGGVKNLGADIAKQLAPLGASLALHYNSPSSKEHVAPLQKELERIAPGIKVKFYQGDLTTEAAVEKLFADVKRDFGRIDIVVNTIGKVLKKPITEISEAEYDSMFAYVDLGCPDVCRLFLWYPLDANISSSLRINSKSAFFILKAGAKYVEDGGKLITIVTALLAAFTGFYTSYAGSKAPVEHFTRGVAKELQGRRVSVNNIAPGPMDTRKLSRLAYRSSACGRTG
ncbi:hypothetical protein VTK73DRAFT_861 [Phialemonium thermophilum]|uniref:NAD(P)-binding protein n=1 Tax=Phialemonium thermophilum TaxID=223376 RepID=A0ABR3VU76_9PEZI